MKYIKGLTKFIYTKTYSVGMHQHHKREWRDGRKKRLWYRGWNPTSVLAIDVLIGDEEHTGKKKRNLAKKRDDVLALGNRGRFQE